MLAAWRRSLRSSPFPFLIREPIEVYYTRSKEYLTSHGLADFRESPLLFRKRQLGLVPFEDRPNWKLGRAAHILILEGRDAYQAAYAFGGPVNPTTGKVYDARTKVYRDWSAKQSKPVLTESQAALVEEMAASVQRHSVAMELLADGVPEGVLRREYCGIPCQARIDWLATSKKIVDLKTCNDIKSFEEDAKRFRYAHQLAFYRALVALETNELFQAYLIAIEKQPPYRCGVWQIDSSVLDNATAENEKAIRYLLYCQQNDYWPTGYEELRTLNQL